MRLSRERTSKNEIYDIAMKRLGTSTEASGGGCWDVRVRVYDVRRARRTKYVEVDCERQSNK